ncbi:hypothetical protein AB6G19_05700 [Providencia manganoxydans]
MNGSLIDILGDLESSLAKTRNEINKEKTKTTKEEAQLSTKAGVDDKNRGYLTYVFVIGFFC